MKALVLCAGFGTRLGELTREIPKPMLPVAGHPLLEYILSHLVRQGFDQIAINVHFRAEAIRDHFGDGARWGCRLSYFHEPSLLGTAGGVRNMASFLDADAPFLVYYGDVLTDQDLTAMLRLHQGRRATATLLVHQRRGSNSVVSLDERGSVVGFLERHARDAPRRRFAVGILRYCPVRTGPLECIPAAAPCDLPRDVFTRLSGTGRLFGFPLSGRRCAVDSPERLAEADLAAAQGHYRLAYV